MHLTQIPRPPSSITARIQQQGDWLRSLLRHPSPKWPPVAVIVEPATDSFRLWSGAQPVWRWHPGSERVNFRSGRCLHVNRAVWHSVSQNESLEKVSSSAECRVWSECVMQSRTQAIDWNKLCFCSTEKKIWLEKYKSDSFKMKKTMLLARFQRFRSRISHTLSPVDFTASSAQRFVLKIERNLHQIWALRIIVIVTDCVF